jgi:hypothetical protein
LAAVWNCAAAAHSSGEYVDAAGEVVAAGGGGGVEGGALGGAEHPARTATPSRDATVARTAAPSMVLRRALMTMCTMDTSRTRGGGSTCRRGLMIRDPGGPGVARAG